ncbi:DUF222 domain-containing protein [Speluncibacter jeojiensis]|uniref:DUF222 domain-containing protein n=1 Tax=Speluncibacter jeojiensis TaxID=2710754 RepID=A0A9X4M0B3_9ACTN|nr:DUF222 domain-containing protein [Corynebacteriales bacterium D3-21]
MRRTDRPAPPVGASPSAVERKPGGYCAEAARDQLRECERAEKLANSEVAVAPTVSERIAQNYIPVSAALRDRLPLVRGAFEAGDLDHRRVDAIWRSTADNDDSLMSRVEAEILAAARRLPPGRLGVEIDRGPGG